MIGNLDYATSEGVTTMSSVLTGGWRPLPVIQISGSYEYSSTTPGDSTKNGLYLSGSWQVKKFMDISMTARYEQEGENSAQGMSANMNLKF